VAEDIAKEVEYRVCPHYLTDFFAKSLLKTFEVWKNHSLRQAATDGAFTIYHEFSNGVLVLKQLSAEVKDLATITCPRYGTENPDDRSNCQKCRLDIQPINRLVFRLMQIVLLMFVLMLSVAGIAIMYIQPLSVLTCRYVETKQVDCQLQERIAWVIPVEENPITHLQEAYLKVETQTRIDEDDNEDTVLVDRIVLVSPSGELVLKGYDDVGSSALQTTRRINDYLNAPTAESLTVWGFGFWRHTLVTLVGGFIFILFVLLFVMGIVNVVFGPGTVTKFFQKVKRRGTRQD
jgi:hypothetical protein